MRERLSYANVMATLAFFIALCGGAYAVGIGRNDVGPREIAKNAVRSSEIKNDGVRGKDVDEASLSQVQSAANADTAASASQAGNADLLGGVGPSGYVAAGTEPVHLVGQPGEPQFEASWANASGGYTPVGFYKDQFGIVHLQGLVNPPGFAGTIFTLPDGYLPASQANATQFSAIADSGVLAPIDVRAGGGVVAGTSNYTETLALDGITFRAAD